MIADLRSLDVRITVIFVTVAVMLLARFFVFNTGFFADKLYPVFVSSEKDRLIGVNALYPGIYWALGCTLVYLVIPLLITVFVFRIKLSECGFSFSGFVKSLPAVVVLYLLMLPFLLYAAPKLEFLQSYPFPKYAHCGPLSDKWTMTQFIVWECFYGLQFFALEFFFRGFMIFPLKEKLGFAAIFPMLVPYVMIHFDKPMPEAFGSVFAGFILGFLALKTRSFYGCFVLHYAIALTMDLLAMSGKHAFQ